MGFGERPRRAPRIPCQPGYWQIIRSPFARRLTRPGTTSRGTIDSEVMSWTSREMVSREPVVHWRWPCLDLAEPQKCGDSRENPGRSMIDARKWRYWDENVARRIAGDRSRAVAGVLHGCRL